jgi:glutamate/tyrosine decarboxylase-like PLP-dependent enzyme
LFASFSSHTYLSPTLFIFFNLTRIVEYSVLNANVHTFEVAPLLTEVERAMLAKVATLWLTAGNGDGGDSGGGGKGGYGGIGGGGDTTDVKDDGETLKTTADAAPPHDGLFVPGGSIANLYSLLLARERACPEAKKSGLPRGYVAFCSEQSHYSYKKW